MKNCKSITSVLGFVLLLMMAATATVERPLTFKYTTVNVRGATRTMPFGISNSGVIVGRYQDKRGDHGFILNGKKLTRLDDPKGKNGTGASNLNPNGAISVVGAYAHSNGTQVGFLYRNGKYTDIPGPTGATSSSADSINDIGAIVGYFTDSSNVMHGFLLKNKTYTTLDVPGSTGTVADGINNKGNIVLFWLDSVGVINSSIYDGKTYKTINVPGAEGSAALDLNNAGDVTYQWQDFRGANQGALLHSGKYYKFDYPKSIFTYAGGINDKRIIVGGYHTKNGLFSGFKASFK